MLEDGEIKKFQTLYKKHFGEEISKEEAVRKGLKLIRLIQLTKPNLSIITQDHDKPESV